MTNQLLQREQRAASSAYSFVPFLVGSVLLVAALFKMQRVWTDSSSASGILESTWFQVIVVEGELACGLALWLGVWPRFLRWSAMLMFAAFFGAAVSQALAGARSCACFGSLEVNPWVAVFLDIGILVVLYFWKTGVIEIRHRAPFGYRWAAVLPFVALLALPIALFAFGRPASYPRLEVTPATLDLGTVAQGERRVFAVHVRNPHQQAVVIREVRSTCPCLKAHALPWLLDPGDEKTVEFALDLGHEPRFIGGLVIETKANTAMGRTAFIARVVLSVVASASYAAGPP